jgi:hypothetical protein
MILTPDVDVIRLLPVARNNKGQRQDRMESCGMKQASTLPLELFAVCPGYRYLLRRLRNQAGKPQDFPMIISEKSPEKE